MYNYIYTFSILDSDKMRAKRTELDIPGELLGIK